MFIVPTTIRKIFLVSQLRQVVSPELETKTLVRIYYDSPLYFFPFSGISINRLGRLSYL